MITTRPIEAQITAKDIQRRLVQYWRHKGNHTYLPNCYFAGGECDFISITQSGYVHEMEIKVSLQDLWADILKDKWKHKDRNAISYFWYCVPESLYLKIPQWLTCCSNIGILAFSNGCGTTLGGMPYINCAIKREATKYKNARKLTDYEMHDILKKSWYRYERTLEV